LLYTTGTYVGLMDVTRKEEKEERRKTPENRDTKGLEIMKKSA
jgi:hypothetical protein